MNREIDLKIIGQLVSSITLLHVFPSEEKAGEFLVQLLAGIPGCLRAGVCFRHSAGPAGGAGECRDCAGRREQNGGDAPYTCGLAGTDNIRAYPFETVTRLYGYLILNVGNAADFGQYEPFLKNLTNSFALTLENRRQQRELRAAGELLEQRINERTAELEASESVVRAKLEAMLAPEGDTGTLEIADIFDIPAIQRIMDEFYELTNIGIGIIGIDGKVLVGTGWQDICTKFHRVHPETARNCAESDTVLTKGVEPGTCRTYLCRNNLRDIATPIMVGGKHVGNLFLGQFLYEDEPRDYVLFREQARRYGFDEKEYLSAYERMPRFSRERVEVVMRFYRRFADLISSLSYGKIKLARALAQSKQAEAEKEKLGAALAEKHKEMENFLYITTHDLRSPLVNIQGFSQNLEAYARELREALLPVRLPPEAERELAKLTGERIPGALKFILESSRKMDSLISALLKVSRLGRVEMKPEAVEMNGLIKKILDSMRYQLEAAGGETVCGSLPPCKADPGAVSQLFSNVLDNAIKYRDKARPLAVTVAGEVKDGMVSYTVADNGSGIPEADLHLIWNMFYQSGRTPGRKGEGIGLPTARRIAEMNGGGIRVESKDGEGSVFYIELPAAEVVEKGK
ncbi:MAG: PocR ligand-binding domain-containing protein [Elusimicrobiota bacterium]